VETNFKHFWQWPPHCLFSQVLQEMEQDMLKKLFVILIFAFFAMAAISVSAVRATQTQDAMVEFKDNNCVACHARLSNPYRLTSRYAEWHISTHKDKSIGCEKCHGGDPAIKDEKQAHAGVVAPQDAKSRLHQKNLPETCGACHQTVVNSFGCGSFRTTAKHHKNGDIAKSSSY